METLSILKLISLNMYFTKIDLADSYYTIPISQDHQKYLNLEIRKVVLHYMQNLNPEKRISKICNRLSAVVTKLSNNKNNKNVKPFVMIFCGQGLQQF